MSNIFPENFDLQNCLSLKLLVPRRNSADFDCKIFFRTRIFAFRFGSLEILKFQCIRLALFYLSDQPQIFGPFYEKNPCKNL